MKNIDILIVMTLLSTPAFSQVANERWFCLVDGEPTKSVEVELRTPTLDYYSRYATPDGQMNERHEELITPKTVTSWKADRKKCSESFAALDDGLRYGYRFNCGSLNGHLDFQRDAKSGFYFEQLGQSRPSRSISFAGCRVVPAAG
jgi:hypothetical protein